MTRLLTRMKRLVRRERQRLQAVHAWCRLVIGAGLAALGYYVGRAAGLFESAREAHQRFGDCEMRPSTMLGVYRERHAASIIGLVEQARQRGMKIALWALDKPLPELSTCTVGCGPGPRMELLNRLWKAAGSADCHQLVITDDDISFTRGSLDQLLRAAITCEFGIAQPAHDWSSQYSYPINRKRPFLLARLTTFVEPGPMFVVTQPWINQVMPFPKNFGMGWGIWVLWLKLQPKGCKLGIVDYVTVNHSSPVGTDYAPALQVERHRVRSLLLEQNFQEAGDAQKTLGAWKMGEASPPWK
ncbi:MAG: hypothetical protein RQ736_03835 [Thiogranum sp.]|nr:hypothetical protein [Thiogranum sp.]